MRTRVTKYLILGVVAILLLSSVAMIVPAGSRVEYALKITDPSGDLENNPVQNDEQAKTNADIIEVTTTRNVDDIVLTMKVSGTINTTLGNYSNTYQFGIDINGDKNYDWLVSTSFTPNANGTHAQMQEDEGTNASWPTLHYLENGSGDGTDTLTIQFPLSYITDIDTIESWDIYGQSGIVVTGTLIGYIDLAPDNKFEGGNGGNETDPNDLDGDGMPNDWEDAYGLDPNDASDADDDNDGDGFTNLDEYEANWDPTDANDPPQGDPGNGDDDYTDPSTETPTDTEISVNIETAKFTMVEKGDKVKVDILVTGTTGGADHVEINFVDVYDDGTKEFNDWEGAFDFMEDPAYKKIYEDMGFTAFHFKDTSDDNWETWEYKISGEVDKDELGDDEPSDENDTVEFTKVKVYIRAFSDDAGSKWNQDSKEVSVKTSDKKDDDDGGLPGFEALFAIAALAIVMIIARVTWRKNK